MFFSFPVHQMFGPSSLLDQRATTINEEGELILYKAKIERTPILFIVNNPHYNCTCTVENSKKYKKKPNPLNSRHLVD